MSDHIVLLITPPFTQLNTPYPATACLKGYLNTLGIKSDQMDLGLEVILRIFSKDGLRRMFREAELYYSSHITPEFRRTFVLREEYVLTVDRAIAYLQGREQTLAHTICEGSFLPAGNRKPEEEDMEWAFGTMGLQDKARHFVTLYLEDIADFITGVIDPHFGFSRYAERLGRSASSFDELYKELHKPLTYIDRLMFSVLREKIESCNPDWVMLSVPFPGNLYSALRCGKFIKDNYPDIRVEMGGGFASTELRQLSDVRVFEYVDFITLDDGETPLRQLLVGNEASYVRTYLCRDGEVRYLNNPEIPDVPMRERGVPDYAGLPLDKYLSVIEVTNPMHALWSNGRWNKLILAHGCYWGKCAFCDGSLDYIGRYEPLTAVEIADRMEEMIRLTGERGFHFVDEAAPPMLLKELALEILKRRMSVVWWTNVRFEKSYTRDLCRLLKQSGCIAVSGGLEVASDRLLKLINKGVSLEQVSRVTDHFTAAGIMVHAYLMYGFPSETAQETIDSLEVVRQLFLNGLVQSAFWHRFALTAHSPVGCHPEKYTVRITEKPFGGFARNDVDFEDTAGADHDIFGEGLWKSLYNYMRGAGFELPLHKWFDDPVPKTQIPPTYVARFLVDEQDCVQRDGHKKVYCLLALLPEVRYYDRNKKGKNVRTAEFLFRFRDGDARFQLKADWGKWLENLLIRLSDKNEKTVTLKDLEIEFKACHFGSFDQFITTPLWQSLREHGLYLL